MRFSETSMPGVLVIDVEPIADDRGYFARTWCDREAAAHGLRAPMVQDSVAFNTRKGTLRGMHYHAPEFPQVRVIRCLAGAAFVAAADLRGEADGRLDVFEIELDPSRHQGLYVPPGVALGYQTLCDDTVIGYKMAELYDPAHERGLRWNDPQLEIRWPDRQPILNARDAGYPDYAAGREPIGRWPS